MPVNAFINLYDKGDGESVQKGHEKQIEIQGWDWQVDAETTWTKGGGASVGKPSPGKMSFQHYFDPAANAIMRSLMTGAAFPKVTLYMLKTTGKGSPETYFTMDMTGCFITHAAIAGTEEGNVTQKVSMVFKTVKIDYKPQNQKDGTLLGSNILTWDIPAGTAA